MKKVWLIAMAVSLVFVTAAAAPALAHNDGTIHIHIKGTVKTGKGEPISGANLNLDSVRKSYQPPFAPPDYTGPMAFGAEANKCLSDVVAVMNPTNAQGNYEVVVRFNNTVQKIVTYRIGTESSTRYADLSCKEAAEHGRIIVQNFQWTREGLSEIHPQ